MNNQTKVAVLCDSISPAGKRITTLQVRFHRFVLAEFNTHRVFSRNFSSSRAIPTATLLKQVRENPAQPVFWGKNQTGMQADVELEGDELKTVQTKWLQAAQHAADQAEQLAALGAHKQIVNRIIEPFVYVNGVVTSTEWKNWLDLRAHKDAQPEIQLLARLMESALAQSKPKLLYRDEWHLPFVNDKEQAELKHPTLADLACKISAARCCRVSYNKVDGGVSTIDEDLKLFDKLASSQPAHMSPLEHQATPVSLDDDFNLNGNFFGWNQFRHIYINQQ